MIHFLPHASRSGAASQSRVRGAVMPWSAPPSSSAPRRRPRPPHRVGAPAVGPIIGAPVVGVTPVVVGTPVVVASPVVIVAPVVAEYDADRAIHGVCVSSPLIHILAGPQITHSPDSAQAFAALCGRGADTATHSTRATPYTQPSAPDPGLSRYLEGVGGRDCGMRVNMRCGWVVVA